MYYTFIMNQICVQAIGDEMWCQDSVAGEDFVAATTIDTTKPSTTSQLTTEKNRTEWCDL